MLRKNQPTNNKVETEKKTFKGAFIVPAPLMEKLVGVYNEMPIKFEPLLKPPIQELLQCVRGDIQVDVPVQPMAPPPVLKQEEPETVKDKEK